jgi:Domain of unknown function (DUF4383)
MLKILAILFGLAFIIFGILGFLPDFKTNGLLLGYFMVNPIHNLIHLATGVIALICGLASNIASKVFFILFGLIYLGIAIYGFYTGSTMILDLVAINPSDNYLHLGIAVVSLFFGLAVKGR